MTKRIFRSIVAAATVVLFLSYSIITGILYHHFSENEKTRLREELNLAAQGVEMNGEQYLKRLTDSNYRITWVGEDGTVIYDTQTDAAVMDNHGMREEIQEASRNGYGESSRYSDTLLKKMIYCAVGLTDGSVLRICSGQDSLLLLLAGVLIPMVGLLVLAVLLAAYLAKRMAKGIVQPLNELDLEHPADNDVYEEITPMLGKINKQYKQIDGQKKELRRKKDEFEQITASMQEGLVLLDKHGNVLSMNESAKHIFGVEKIQEGQSLLVYDRSLEMSRAVEDAYSGRRREFQNEKNGRIYHFSVSKTESQGRLLGVVILCIDVTEAVMAEKKRQEFTANVSHELKTPLHSIMGSAELLESGLVKEDDQKRFVGHIRKEAERLLTLINDIIRLSQLDEDSEQVKEEVDLYQLAEEVLQILEESAERKKLTLTLEGEHCMIHGIRNYLYEIIYNLCDNAIRYNRDNGNVTVNLKEADKGIHLSVSDTGIGIPREHHSRIFERFYRVDKSHSKETGGTGLGLSIVKHAAACHNGKIGIESEPDKGTRISIYFEG